VHLSHALAFGRKIILNHLGKSDDGGQDVIEVMGDAPGKRADGFHLLSLPYLPFEPLPLGDVVPYGKYPGKTALFIM
jgi:hypothetical protein